MINLDVRGQTFKTSISTLQSIPGSRLSRLDVSRKTHFFDEDPQLFRYILNAHHDKEVHAPRDVCPNVFRKQLSFWGIPIRLLAPCCWKTLYEADNDRALLEVVVKGTSSYDSHNRIDPAQESVTKKFFGISPSAKRRKNSKDETENGLETKTLRERLWMFLEEPGFSTAAKIWLFFYIFVVVVSAIIYIVWLESGVRVPAYLDSKDRYALLRTNLSIKSYYVNLYGEQVILLVSTDPHRVLLILDICCMVFFIVETLIHFLVCPDKLRYFLSLHHLFKILLSASMIASTYLEYKKNLFADNEDLGKFYHSCKSLNVVRLFMIFRLRKVYKRLDIMIISLNRSIKELVLLLFSFVITVVVYGCLMFSAEIDTSAFPDAFYAMWWSVITMTTIGYGDFYPVSWRGYIVGVFCAITGIIVLALPVAAIASTFSDMFSRNADFQKHLDEIRKEEERLRLNPNDSLKDKRIRNGMTNQIPASRGKYKQKTKKFVGESARPPKISVHCCSGQKLPGCPVEN